MSNYSTQEEIRAKKSNLGPNIQEVAEEIDLDEEMLGNQSSGSMSDSDNE